jgi:hypothetical protein
MEEEPPHEAPIKRSFALYMFVIGAAFLVWQVWSLRSGGTYYSKLICLGLMLAPMGFFGLIEPRLLRPGHPSYANDSDIGFIKLFAWVGFTILMVLGLYLAIGLEAGWPMPEAVSNFLMPQ